MKITEETRIKDLIREGYEFVDADSAQAYSDEEGGVTLFTLNTRKKQKDFNSYWSGYMNRFYDNGGVLCADPLQWRWEYRVGLLRFICDDLGVSFAHTIAFLNHKYVNHVDGPNSPAFQGVIDICPKEFLTSIV